LALSSSNASLCQAANQEGLDVDTCRFPLTNLDENSRREVNRVRKPNDSENSVGLCWLCARPIGSRVEYHHPVPKSRGGRETVPIHPICHRTLHKSFTNKELERLTLTELRASPEIAAFLGWIRGKHPDFHAPTHRRR